MEKENVKIYDPRSVSGISILSMLDFGTHMEKVSSIDDVSIYSVRPHNDGSISTNQRLRDGTGLNLAIESSDKVVAGDPTYPTSKAFIAGVVI